MIIALVTFLETELYSYLRGLHNRLDLEIGYNELKGTFLDQFKTYVTKVVMLEIEFESRLWQSLKELVELRNCIVHFDANLEDTHGRKFSRSSLIISLSKKFDSIKIDEKYNYFYLEKSACEKSIKLVSVFIQMIYSKTLEYVNFKLIS